MNCRSAESFFSSYLEDEISQEERRALEAHLMGCRRCSLGIRETRAAMSLMQQMPPVAPSARFDDDLYARIRSGEGLSTSPADILREIFSPARLRPVFVTGAALCAVFIGFVLSPVAREWAHRTPSAPPLASVQASRPAPSVAATGPAQTKAAPVVPETQSARPQASVVASAPRPRAAVRDSIVDSKIPEQRYMDEIINDQFYIERGRESVVPVNETSDDGVYIIF